MNYACGGFYTARGPADLAGTVEDCPMKDNGHRPLPLMKSFEDAVSLCDIERDNFYTDAFMLHAWIGHLLDQALADYGDQRRSHSRIIQFGNDQALADYGDQRRSHSRIMQFGQAQRGFLQVFGNLTDTEFQNLLHNCHRFTGRSEERRV